MLVKTVLETLRSVVRFEDFVALHEPSFEGNEWSYVKECLDSGWVSSVGEFVDRFERELADYTGAKYAVAVVNGTAALHISLLLVGVQPGDEVLVPALTFVATANAVAYCGATPHFVDSEDDTLGIDSDKLWAYLEGIGECRDGELWNRHTGRRIKAVVPMHTFGHPVDLDSLVKLCERFKLELIEDAAESLGTLYKGRHTGNWGRVSALSFNGNKIITTGGGGAILTNDQALAQRAKHLTTTAKQPHRWRFDHDQVGFNYRLPNINAALGCAQLEKLSEFVARKRKLTDAYVEAFGDVEGLALFIEPAFARSNYWLNTLVLDRADGELRDSILEVTNAGGIMCRPVWTLMSKLPMYENCPKMDLSCSKALEARLINIPSSPHLGSGGAR